MRGETFQARGLLLDVTCFGVITTAHVVLRSLTTSEAVQYALQFGLLAFALAIPVTLFAMRIPALRRLPPRVTIAIFLLACSLLAWGPWNSTALSNL